MLLRRIANRVCQISNYSDFYFAEKLLALLMCIRNVHFLDVANDRREFAANILAFVANRFKLERLTRILFLNFIIQKGKKTVQRT